MAPFGRNHSEEVGKFVLQAEIVAGGKITDDRNSSQTQHLTHCFCDFVGGHAHYSNHFGTGRWKVCTAVKQGE